MRPQFYESEVALKLNKSHHINIQELEHLGTHISNKDNAYKKISKAFRDIFLHNNYDIKPNTELCDR